MSRRLKILTVAGIVLCLAILIPIVHHYQLRFAVEKYISELKAKGEPMELAQVIPPPTLPDRNGAPLITNAFAQIYLERNWTNGIFFRNSPGAMNRAIPGKEMIGWHQPVIHNPEGNWPTNTWDELGTQLAERQNDLDDLRNLIANPVMDFSYDYSNPKNYLPSLAPHLSQMKLAVQWLQASEIYNLHLGKTTAACSDVRAMLALVKGQTNERFLVSQLVRFALAQMVANATWNVLQTTNITDENLVQLQRDWQSLAFIPPLTNAFLFERVDELRLVEDLRSVTTNLASEVSWAENLTPRKEGAYQYERTEDGRYILVDKRSFLQRTAEGVSTQWNEFRWRWFLSYTDEERGIRMWRSIILGTQLMETKHSYQSVEAFLKSNFSQLGFGTVTNDPYALISRYANNQLAAVRRVAGIETTRILTVTAVALKRYEKKHRQLPNELVELVPDFLEAVPNDYMDGQPLRYRRNADGTFLLYSVGDNCMDDGGNGAWDPSVHLVGYSWQYSGALDWVWPQPATPEEIQKYYEEQAKKSGH